MFITKNLRISRAYHRASEILDQLDSEPADVTGIQEVIKRLRSHQVVLVSGEIVVTEAGFVTMAILPRLATEQSGMLAVPGIDERGQRGHLVIRPDSPPYHSLQDQPAAAITEAKESLAKSEKLVAVFGGKTKMLRAVSQAPLLLLSTVEDFEKSGLCLWGAESFLKRIGMLSIARRFGLPRFLLKWSGPYGIRLTAAALQRCGMKRESTKYLPQT